MDAACTQLEKPQRWHRPLTVKDHLSKCIAYVYFRTTLFFLRAWRWQCIKKDNSIQHCITSNVYWCLELNAHEMVHFLIYCRENNVPEQFLPQILNSQPCETSFRELRSMTTMNHTAINFTMKDVEQRMQRVQMKLLIAHRRKNMLSFPSLRKNASKALAAKSYDLPDDDQISQSIKKAEEKATELLLSVGFSKKDINFTNSLILRNSDVTYEFEYVDVGNITDTCEDSTNGKYSKINYIRMGTDICIPLSFR